MLAVVLFFVGIEEIIVAIFHLEITDGQALHYTMLTILAILTK
jgi:hypothetical protein